MMLISAYLVPCVVARNAPTSSTASHVASSRCSVSQGAAQKTARKKIKKKRGERKLPLATLFFIFSRAVFCAKKNKQKKRGERKLPLAALFLFFRALFSALRPD